MEKKRETGIEPPVDSSQTGLSQNIFNIAVYVMLIIVIIFGIVRGVKEKKQNSKRNHGAGHTTSAFSFAKV